MGVWPGRKPWGPFWLHRDETVTVNINFITILSWTTTYGTSRGFGECKKLHCTRTSRKVASLVSHTYNYIAQYSQTLLNRYFIIYPIHQHQTIKIVKVKPPRFLHFGNRWRWIISFTLQPFAFRKDGTHALSMKRAPILQRVGFMRYLVEATNTFPCCRTSSHQRDLARVTWIFHGS